MEEPVLELGSGAGFLDEFVLGLLTSDIVRVPGLSLILDGQCLPFRDCSLRSVVMVDVLHHLSRPRRFFSEASRCLVSGGKIVMVEPWVTSWSRIIYSKFHHEPFDPDAKNWEFPRGCPLSAANGALPWIVFQRDRHIFELEFPELKVERVRPIMPFSYLLSGGVSIRSLVPGSFYEPCRTLERLAERWSRTLPMFAGIVVAKDA